MAPKTTMLDLVTALSRSVRTDAEVVADVAFLVNTGQPPTAIHAARSG